MHVVFGTRGIKQATELWLKFMETRMFKAKVKNLQTGQDEFIAVQGALRPIQLWDYVFPEEALDQVLSMMEADKNNWNEKEDKVKTKVLQKALNLDPMPKKWNKVDAPYLMKDNVAFYFIGTKKDVKGVSNDGKYEHEKL